MGSEGYKPATNIMDLLVGESFLWTIKHVYVLVNLCHVCPWQRNIPCRNPKKTIALLLIFAMSAPANRETPGREKGQLASKQMCSYLFILPTWQKKDEKKEREGMARPANHATQKW